MRIATLTLAHLQRRHVLLALALSLALATALLGVALPTSAAPVTLRGRLFVLNGNPDPGSALRPQIVYFLIDDAGRQTDLLIDPALFGSAGVGPYVGQRVVVSGDDQSTPERQIVRVSSIALDGAPPPSVPPPVLGTQAFVTILCRFADSPTMSPVSKAQVDSLLGSGPTGLDTYYRELSYQQMDLSGSVVVGWYVLPQPRSYYVDANGLNFARARGDCTHAADSDVFFPNFYGVNMLFNQVLDGASWGGTAAINIDGQNRIYGDTFLAPNSWAGTWAHEMGHALGWRHSSGPYGQVYDSKFDQMSSSGGTCVASDPVFACLPEHTISYHKNLQGWIPSNRLYTPALGSSTSISIFPTSGGIPASGYLMAKIPFRTNANRFYTVEVRRKTGFDVNVGGEGVLVMDVDPTRTEPAHVVDTDLDGDPNDSGAVLLPGESFSDPLQGVTVSVTGTGDSGEYLVTVAYPTTAPAGGTINGTVTDGTNAINAASVIVTSITGGSFGKTLASNGAYSIGNLEAGTYRVQACMTAFACEFDNNVYSPAAATAVTVTAGNTTSGINFSLGSSVPDGSISGTVSGPSGALAASVSACPAAGGSCVSANAGANGAFSIAGLTPRDYRVFACMTGYACQYFSGVYSSSAFTAVTVYASTDTPGTNFSLIVQGTITGTVTAVGAGALQGVSLQACPIGNGGFCVNATSAANGTYTISRLAPVVYRVQACLDGYDCAYYNDVLYSAWATGAPVSSGANTPNVNFQLRPVATDSDSDGYSDQQEVTMNEDYATFCAAMRADVDGDGSVSVLDLASVAAGFGSAVTPATARLDQDKDGHITILDMALMAGIYLVPVVNC